MIIIILTLTLVGCHHVMVVYWQHYCDCMITDYVEKINNIIIGALGNI